MNIKLIKSLLPDIKRYKDIWWSQETNKEIDDIINNSDNLNYYNNNLDFFNCLHEFLLSHIDINHTNHEIQDYIILYDTVVKLKDGRFIKFKNYFIPDHGSSCDIEDFMTIEEMLNSIKEVFPVEKTVIVYE